MRSLCFLAAAIALFAAPGCGSRTGLFVPEELPPESPGQSDATLPQDAGVDAPFEAPADSLDAPHDVTTDVAPDVSHPVPIGCEDASVAATLIYLITLEADLWSFYPPSLEFRRIGRIDCETDASTPFSMAVDQTGIAYVVYSDGKLYRVSTATASCEPTNFAPDQPGFSKFGMGYSLDPSGLSETLYVASDEDGGLGFIDTTSFVVHRIGNFPPQVVAAELTGTGSGELFAFYSLAPTNSGPAPPPSAIGQVDKADANIIQQTILQNVGQGCAWAFAFWGGDFYMFTSPGVASPMGPTCPPTPTPSPSAVTRYSPADGSVVQITSLGEQIVGAGVSTCAPQE